MCYAGEPGDSWTKGLRPGRIKKIKKHSKRWMKRYNLKNHPVSIEFNFGKEGNYYGIITKGL